MAEWLYEAGIGEARAALVADGAIVEMTIERDDGAPRAGAVVEARLTRAADATGRALAELEDATPLVVTPAPPLPVGHKLRLEIVREAIPSRRDSKHAHARPTDAPPAPGPPLRDRLTGAPVRELLPHQPDLLEAAGWSEALEEAASGIVARDAALLRIDLTAAMTLIDVDGALPPAALAVAGAKLAGEAIRRLAIAGSIGIDLPTLPGRADRLAAAQALDAALPQPFERTAVNGFGFLQLVRRRVRPALIETLQADPPLAAALALLRRAERDRPGARRLVAAPPVVARLEARPDWIETLARRTGGPVALRADPALAISAGHVEPVP